MHIRDAAGNSLASNDDRDGTDDRCSVIEFGLLAGQTRYVHVMDYDDDDAIPGYALQVTYTPVVCGNGAVEIGEQCDDTNTTAGDGCGATCQIEVVCGDGVLQPTEHCDDMNTMAGDGCSATCQVEGASTEVEPNEDGTPSLGGSGIDGNDFGATNADTNGAITMNTTIAAALDPDGDEDVFKITNTGAATVELHLDVWNPGPGYHIGMPCGTSVDTAMHVRDAAGTSLASNDDRDGANDRCSTLRYALPAGATVYAHVSAYDDEVGIPTYALVVQFVPIVCGDNTVALSEECDDGNTMNGDGCSSTCTVEVICGDGVLHTPEQCDDGNTMNGDGCNATCQFEIVNETEPNDDGTPMTGSGIGISGNDFLATAANGPFSHSIVISAAMAVAGDEDVFAFTNTGAAAVNVRFDVWNLASGFGIGASCGTLSIDTGLTIRDATGTSLASSDDRVSGTDYCSGNLVYSIPAGATVYAHVVEYGDDATIMTYALQAVYQ
jgi:cysteine-rich repeat protein